MNPILLIMPHLPLLHGAAGPYDELLIFGGMGLLLVALGYLSWRSTKSKDERRKKRRVRRKR